jgi:aquaporin Z
MVFHFIEDIETRKSVANIAKAHAPYVMEFVGTFFLTLTIALVGGESLENFIVVGFLGAFAIGWMLAIMVYAGGRISGGHYNPAVTLSVFLSGQVSDLTIFKTLMYFGVQTFGALMGAFIAYGCTKQKGVQPNYDKHGTTDADGVAFTVEFFYTFALCFVVLNTAVAKSQIKDNSFFGFCIGTTVLVGALTCGALSGAVFNPAVATGLFISSAVVGGPKFDSWAIYYVAEFLASVFAAIVFAVLNSDDYFPEEQEGIKSSDGNATKNPLSSTDKSISSDT